MLNAITPANPRCFYTTIVPFNSNFETRTHNERGSRGGRSPRHRIRLLLQSKLQHEESDIGHMFLCAIPRAALAFIVFQIGSQAMLSWKVGGPDIEGA